MYVVLAANTIYNDSIITTQAHVQVHKYINNNTWGNIYIQYKPATTYTRNAKMHVTSKNKICVCLPVLSLNQLLNEYTITGSLSMGHFIVLKRTLYVLTLHVAMHLHTLVEFMQYN